MIAVMINGQGVDSEHATVSVFDHGFLFGDSVYEVIRTRERRLFATPMHLKRLRYSAHQIGLEIPWSDDKLIGELQTLRDRIDGEECYLRLIVTRGVGPLSIDPEGCDAPNRIMFGRPLVVPEPRIYREGICLHLSDIRKNPLSMENGNIKTGNYLDHVMAIKEARRHGCQEALLLNYGKRIAECTTSNIFWVRGGALNTPSLKAGILKGVTRQVVMHLASRLGIAVHEGLFPIASLMEADEAFITSTTRDVLPIGRIGAKTFAVGPVTKRLMQEFAQVEDLDLDF